MRLWSLHPRYLDRLGLLACWREALLAQKVLEGLTKGYRHHPQLVRFRQATDPLAALATYLTALADEAQVRGYSFDRSKILPRHTTQRLPVQQGQVQVEWEHLKTKHARRDPSRLDSFATLPLPETHPLFEMVPGGIEAWERLA